MQLYAFRLDVDGVFGGGGGVHLVIHLTLFRSNEEKAFFKNSIEGFVRSLFCVCEGNMFICILVCTVVIFTVIRQKTHEQN